MNKPIRLRITSHTCEGNVTYLIIHHRRVSYLNRSGDKMKFKSLAPGSIELQFHLEDAVDAQEAHQVLQQHLGKNRAVEVL